jgi:hypothetical protein
MAYNVVDGAGLSYRGEGGGLHPSWGRRLSLGTVREVLVEHAVEAGQEGTVAVDSNTAALDGVAEC